MGLVQAMVFMLLTAVFTLLMSPHTQEGSVRLRMNDALWRLDRAETREPLTKPIERRTEMFPSPLLAEITGSLHVAFAAIGAPWLWV